jgi:peptidoglycan-associated lipoprotein
MNTNIKSNIDKMNFKYIYTFFACFCFLALQGQPTTKITYETKLKVADESARNYDYYSAIKWFNEAYRESKDTNLKVAVADLYSLARDYKKAAKGYERILKRDKRGDYMDLRLDLGNMYKFQGMYTEAMEQYNLVLANTELDDELKMLAKQEIVGIEGMNNMNDNLEAVITFHEGKINSGSAESAPVLGADGTLYFSSFNKKKEIILDGEQGDYHAKIYKAEPDAEGVYKKARKLNDKINRKGFHHGGVSLSRDGKTMYFTRAKLNNNAVESSKIMASQMTDRGWGAPVELASVNGDFISKHPYEGDLFGNKVLYFSSNMEGGEGGYDIYYADLDGTTIGTPVNLGNTLNTSEDEISPYYSDGTMYFSSKGHPNMGGHDIYYTTWNGSAWDVPTNMGFNYNSSYDDMFLRFNKAGTKGHLVSNRPDKDKKKLKGNESCCDDIYTVFIKELIIDLAAKVEDENGPLNGASLELFDLTLGSYPDSKTNFDDNSFNFPLEADRSYKAFITKEGYYPDSIEFNTVGIEDDYSVSKTIVLKAMPVEEPEMETFTINEPIRLNNIYYDFNKADILPASEKDLEVLLDLMYQYSDMEIELSAHTDARGKAPYNRKLSQRRADSARAWLIAEGVDADRMTAVGYGESVILNQCADGVRCSDEDHRLNRRTEFKITAGPTTIQVEKSVLGLDKKKTK